MEEVEEDLDMIEKGRYIKKNFFRCYLILTLPCGTNLCETDLMTVFSSDNGGDGRGPGRDRGRGPNGV